MRNIVDQYLSNYPIIKMHLIDTQNRHEWWRDSDTCQVTLLSTCISSTLTNGDHGTADGQTRPYGIDNIADEH